MTFTKSIEICFNKFADFNGRASKSEFWWFQLFYVIVLIVGSIIDHLMGYKELFYWVGYVICLLPGLAVGARRLHDIGRTGWWQLLYLTIIGTIVLIVWWVADGGKKNKYGAYQIKLKDYEDLSKKLEQCVQKYSKSKIMIKNAKKKIYRFYYKNNCPSYLKYLKKINLS